MSDLDGSLYHPIGDYALIGDCRSAALISRSGSIDWLCWPRFDSPSIFAALVDWRRGGCFRIAPVEPFMTTRRYVGETAVLETTFRTANGVARLTDLMPVASEAEKGEALWPDHELLRWIECLSGTVEIEVLFDPRPDYGRVVPRLVDQKAFGLVCEHQAQVIALRSEIPLETGEEPGARGRARLQAGDARTLSVTYDRWLPVALSPTDGAVEHRIARSIAWWEGWMRLSVRRCVRGRGAPQCHHAQAPHLRALRRGRRGADGVAPGGGRRRTQLGLSLLLAA